MPQMVLILTHSGDYFTVDRVIEALHQSGIPTLRFNTDQFPLSIPLTLYLQGSTYCSSLETDQGSIHSTQISSVWFRRLGIVDWAQTGVDPAFQEACARESIATLYGFFDSLHHANWIDSLSAISQADNKLYQLRLASEVGLTIPRTVVTNDPTQARQLFHELHGQVIAKLLTPFAQSMDGSAPFVYTNRVQASDLQEAESLRYSPMVFQELIPKQRELRVVSVDGQLFVGSLDASMYEAYTQDWRQSTTSHWQQGDLPDPLANKLRQLMARLGLRFGAIDLIETPQNDYVFLEVNPTGEWGMLEKSLGYPIAAAIAQGLSCQRAGIKA